jgi:tetratricopeptide (TPR) repeat protein
VKTPSRKTPDRKTPDRQAAAAAEADLHRAVEAARQLAQHGGDAGLSQAITVLDAALEASEQHLPALLLRSRLRARSGNLVGAIKDAASAVTADPEGVEANALLSEHMVTMGNLDEAAMFAYEALKAAPLDPARFVALAGILRAQGSYAAAEELFDAAGKLAPDDADIALSHMDCLMRLDRTADAIRFGKAALLRFKDDVRILRTLGDALRLTGRNDAAEALLVANGVE